MKIKKVESIKFEELHLLLLAQKEKVNELQSKLDVPYKFSNALEVMKKLGAELKVNNTSDSPIAVYNKILCDNKKLGSCVLLENSGSDLGEDNKWNVVKVSSKRDIWSNHYVPNSLKSESFLNLFNSKGESVEDFVWETKSNSNQNSAWVVALKKTKVFSNP